MNVCFLFNTILLKSRRIVKFETLRFCSNSTNASAIDENKVTVGWIGLGAMGAHMAAKFAERSGKCLVWNRTTTTALSHSKQFGSIFCLTLKDFAENSPMVIFSCVPTSNEVRQVVEQVIANLPDTDSLKYWVDCTSGEPTATRMIGERLKKHGIQMLDCPVSGGPQGAESGNVTMMSGGNKHAFNSVKPLTKLISKKQVYVGNLGSGHAVKVMNNILNSTHLIAAAEGLVALCKMGIDPKVALLAINDSSGRSLQTEVRFPATILTRKFNYNFKLGLMDKDVNIANTILDAYYPEAKIMRVTKELSNKSLTIFGFDADYTEYVRFIEKMSGVLIKSPLKSKSYESVK